MSGSNGLLVVVSIACVHIAFTLIKSKKIIMSRVLLIILLSISTMQVGFAQNTEIGNTGDGRRFLKRVENNLRSSVVIISEGKVSRSYNLESKTAIERLFFGDINAMVEFYIEPSLEASLAGPFKGAYGFRMVKDSLDTFYIIEIKYISNWKEVTSKLIEAVPYIDIYDKRHVNRYDAGDISCPVKDEFVNKVYGAISSMIKNFVMKGEPAGILDGYTVTFRCVVGDEVWTLTCHVPDGELEQLTEVCKHLIEDIKNNNFDELKYIGQINAVMEGKHSR
jgi:hypothetical protein